MNFTFYLFYIMRVCSSLYSSAFAEHCEGVTLEFVTDKLKQFAQTALAESWDNVGLLLEPAKPHLIRTILLTNDLTEDVMDEALSIMADLIITYHPLIFTPLKRITRGKWKDRIVSTCLANNIAVYSPHTSWDIVQGGVNDWLVSAFKCSEVKPLVRKKVDPDHAKFTLVVESRKDNTFDDLKRELTSSATVFKLLSEEPVLNSSNFRSTIHCDNSALKQVVPKLRALESSNDTQYVIHPEQSVTGIGRICQLDTPISIRDAIDIVKKHVGIPFVQLALARCTTATHTVQTIAFAAGSGGSLLRNIKCDLKVTGESSHHDILDSIHQGSSVILTHHSNSERGFLQKFKELLTAMLNNSYVKTVVSAQDADPLTIL